jgi:hypothetical protein
MEEQNRREREREREYWFQDSLLSHVACFLQREARGSVTFKIVPSYRSAPPPCEVRQHPSRFIHTYARPSDLYPFLKHVHSLSSDSPHVDATTTDWQIYIFLSSFHNSLPIAVQFSPSKKKEKKVFHNLPSFWPLFKMRQSMRVGRVSLWNSLSLLWFALSFSKAIFQSQERVKRRMKLFHVIFEYVIVVP